MRPILVSSSPPSCSSSPPCCSRSAGIRPRPRPPPASIRRMPLSSTPLYLLVRRRAADRASRAASLVPSLAGFQQRLDAGADLLVRRDAAGTSLIVGAKRWPCASRSRTASARRRSAAIYMWSAIWSIIGSRVRSGASPTPDVPLTEMFTSSTAADWSRYGGMIGGFLPAGTVATSARSRCGAGPTSPRRRSCWGPRITRVGCLLFGCDFGRRVGDRFLDDRLCRRAVRPGSTTCDDLGLASRRSLVVSGAPDADLRIPLVGLFLFELLLLLRRYRRFSGQVFLGWVVGYGILRSIIEIVRDDDDRGLCRPFTTVGLSTSQIIGIGLGGAWTGLAAWISCAATGAIPAALRLLAAAPARRGRRAVPRPRPPSSRPKRRKRR